MSGGSGNKNSQPQHSRGSAGAKLVDESHMKSLRELCALPGNRNCFECGQRAPNYVDVTIGSFICMTCSGLLRGITPPHRVKSISMATFTPEEIQLLKARGNEYCRKVWLATYTARDSSLTPAASSTSKSSSSEIESDRRNTLKSHMSAKYEQKRYWVDPSQIPDLEEIGVQNAKALSTSSSTSGSSGSVGGSSNSNRSPSLSSASSGSSLSQAQHSSGVNVNVNGVNGTPSPILNNLRNNNSLTLNHPCPPSSMATSHPHPHNRLVSSATLPDIKPLASLFNGGGSIQPPFNFINNLSSNHQQQQQHDDKIINTNPQQKDPWGNGDSASNGFNADFANFDEAFSSSSANGNFDAFSNGNGNGMKGDVNQHQHQNHGVGIGDGGFAIFDKPLVPLSQNGVGHGPPSGTNNDLNGHGHGHGRGFGDRYAALKDLDELFKHGDPVVANNTNPSSNGMTSSASMPANLSSSLGSSSSGTGNGWPIGNGHSNHNQFQQNQASVPNPFSMFGTSPNAQTNTNGWGPSNSNPHNPFAATAAPSSSAPSWPSNSPFGASQGHGHGPNNQQQSQLFQFGGNNSSGASKTMFNPFAATATTAPTNPHNPFL